MTPFWRQCALRASVFAACTILGVSVAAQSTSRVEALATAFAEPPAEARPWTFWYWIHGAVDDAGITADLESMADAGLGGAYVFSLLKAGDDPYWETPVKVLSPEYWGHLRHAFSEADRLGLKLGLHAGPGFSLAGGPWNSPAQSMQHVVWTETAVQGGQTVDVTLPQPTTRHDYYGDLTVFAVKTTAPLPTPVVRSSFPGEWGHLADGTNTQPLRSEDPCTIDFVYEAPQTVRSVRIRPHGNNYQAMRLKVEASDDGQTFRPVAELKAPRHGWQDMGMPVTYALPETTAKVFRFAWDPAGSEPGAEDLDWAKWSPVLKIRSIELSGAAKIHGFEGKTGVIWRVSEGSPDDLRAFSRREVIDLTKQMQPDGQLHWKAPKGDWTIYRMGFTTTGTTNYNGAEGEGLEVDKLSAEAVRWQLENWIGETRRQVGPELFGRVMAILHSDSWETGSQNWTPRFAEEFKRRRGYELRPWLPLFAGVPLESAEKSEAVLRDIRQTIDDLVAKNFYGTLHAMAQENGWAYSAESMAPTMIGDNLRTFAHTDLPMGEFWIDSPTHDKPADMLDAISGARIYGKPIVQAEAFTQLRLEWDESPGSIKTLGDRQFALGINRFIFHVFSHTPWTDREPGVSLNGVGLFIGRGQTWWHAARSWIDYLARTQALLQVGQPVVDVAVYPGDELPRRAVLPEELIDTLPGLYGAERVAKENERRANVGQPRAEVALGVKANANITSSAEWVDALRGYQFDSLNPEVLAGAKVVNRRLVLPSGANFGVLVVPGARAMNPAGYLSKDTETLLKKFERQGLPVIRETYTEATLEPLGVAPDFLGFEADGHRAENLAWTHRRAGDVDLYFVSNQADTYRAVEVSLRVAGKQPELWSPVDGSRQDAPEWRQADGRTTVSLRLEPAESIFIVLARPTKDTASPANSHAVSPVPHQRLDGPWQVTFPGIDEVVTYKRYLESWTLQKNPAIQHFSGTATYRRDFEFDPAVTHGRVWLDLGEVADVAEVWINDQPAGTLWTPPWRLDISDLLRPGQNSVRIDVTNTWGNRIIYDQTLPEAQRQTWTNAPFRLGGRDLTPAGLLGSVLLLIEEPKHLPPAPIIPIPAEIRENAREVSAEDMQRVYDEVKTPYKYGVILKGEEGELLDCPNVFRHGDKWYMMFVANKNGVGYETFLAESDDLLNWKRLGPILPFPETGWDKWQGDGGVSLMDLTWGGSMKLQAYEGKYWMSYIGGSMKGYETDPLSAGLAWTTAPDQVAPWTRLESNPVLQPNHAFSRPFEEKTVYKSHIIWDREEHLGWPFVMYYNGKEERGGGHEAIGMAVSRDLKTWHRYGDNHIIYDGEGSRWAISGDPQIVKMGDLWVMFYFGAFWKPKAFDTFAVSYDMVNWTKWQGPHLIEPSESWDKDFAHKPWLLKHDGVVYHFYCAVGDQGRVIALATSKDLTNEATPKQP